MKKILAFAGSNHATSINHQLIEFTTSLIHDFEVYVLDLRKWDVAMYSIDMDPDQTPQKITELIALIKENDGFIISSPEHNGSTPAFFKNILDWLSRREKNVFENKPVFLMSTSPGPNAGAKNLSYLISSLPRQGAQVPASYSLPSFPINFIDGKVIGDQLDQLTENLATFKDALLS